MSLDNDYLAIFDFDDQSFRNGQNYFKSFEIRNIMDSYQDQSKIIGEFQDQRIIFSDSSTYQQEKRHPVGYDPPIQPCQTMKAQQQHLSPPTKKKSNGTLESNDEQFNPQKEKGQKRLITKPAKGYPTKNFLVNFKKSHIQFLVKHLGKSVLQHTFIREISEKNGINMLDYQALYTTQEYQPVFAKYFQLKTPYRDLMHSRVNSETKKIYMSRIPVFQKSFKEGRFNHIN